MRRDAAVDEDVLSAPLTAFEDVEYADEEEAEATLSSAGAAAPRQRRYPKRATLRVLPWVALAAVAGIVLLALPGGLGVALCAARGGRAPAGVALAGYRGTEWPYAANTLRAARASALTTMAVHLDVVAAADRGAYAVTGGAVRLEHTTNGSGVACRRSAAYLEALSVSPPTYDPAGQAARAPPCADVQRNGTRTPCTYRVPSVDAVFGDLPAATRYLLQVDSCASPACTAVGKHCPLAAHIKAAATRHFITPHKLSLLALEELAVNAFRADTFFADADFILIAGRAYLHFAPDSFVAMLGRGRWDGVAFTPTLAAWRPDIFRAVTRARAVRTTSKLQAYVLPVRTDWDLRLATCSGAKNLVVSDVAKVIKTLGNYKSPAPK